MLLPYDKIADRPPIATVDHLRTPLEWVITR